MNLIELLRNERSESVRRITEYREWIASMQENIANKQTWLGEQEALVKEIDAALAKLDPENYKVGP